MRCDAGGAYRFPPLRNAVLAGVLTLVGVILHLDGGETLATDVLFCTGIVLGACSFISGTSAGVSGPVTITRLGAAKEP